MTLQSFLTSYHLALRGIFLLQLVSKQPERLPRVLEFMRWINKKEFCSYFDVPGELHLKLNSTRLLRKIE